VEVEYKELEIVSKQFASSNILKVSAGTNGYHDGDNEHNSKTYFAIEDLLLTNIKFKINNQNNFKDLKKIEILLEGDTELSTIIDSLEFIVSTLKFKLHSKK